MQDAAAPRGGEVDEVDLRVRTLELGPRAHEGRRVAGADRQRPFTKEQVFEADARFAEKAPMSSFSVMDLQRQNVRT